MWNFQCANEVFAIYISNLQLMLLLKKTPNAITYFFLWNSYYVEIYVLLSFYFCVIFFQIVYQEILKQTTNKWFNSAE